MELQSLLKKRSCSIEEGISIFDSLEPVTLDFMKGQWKGHEIKTGHFMEGLLEPLVGTGNCLKIQKMFTLY